MLQRIRDKATGPVAWLFVGLISVPFAIWGIDFYFTPSSNPVVAEVGSVEITRSDLQRAYEQRLRQLQQLMGDSFQHDMIEPKSFRREVLDGLINEHALSQHLDDAGLRMGDTAVNEYVRSIPAFQVDGKFSTDAYRDILAREGRSPAAFESNVREFLAAQQLRDSVLQTAFVTDTDIKVAWQLARQQRHLKYLLIEADQFADQVKLSDEDVQAYYESNRQAYTLPERVKLAYVELDRNAMKPAEEPDEEYMQTLYQIEQKRFMTTERRQARHILLLNKEGAEDARQRLAALRAEIESGAEFEDLAKEHSEDPGSKENGGLLDLAERGLYDPAFEDTLFSLEEGEVSQPVESAFGWHLIKLEKVEPEQTRPLTDETVREELLKIYREKELEQRYRQYVGRLTDLSQEHGDDLVPVASELGLEVKKTDWLKREGGTGLGQYEQVMTTAFEEEMLEDRINSDAIELSSDRQVVIRVLDYEPERLKPLDEVEKDIRNQLRLNRGRELARAEAARIVKAINEGTAPRTLARSSKASYKDMGLVTRDHADADVALIDALFSLPRPDENQVSMRAITINGSDQAVLVLDKVVDASLAEADEAELEAFKRSLLGRTGGAEQRAYMASLRERLDVEINEEQL